MKPGLRNTVLLGTTAAFLLTVAPTLFADDAKKENKITLQDGKVKVESALKDGDDKDKVQQQLSKVFTVDLKNGQTYQIDMASKEIDSYLRLEDASGKELAKDDDSGGNLDARIRFHCPKDGTYHIIGTTFGGGTGAFTLTIQQAVATKTAELTLKDGAAQVDSTLTDTDAHDTVRKQSACKTFAVKLAKGKPYQIDMMSKALDSYLRLEDASGKELAKDDDGGDGFNARIVFNCAEDGVYRIVATTFNGGTGGFTLAVKEK